MAASRVYLIDRAIAAAREIVEKSGLSTRAFAIASGIAPGALRTMKRRDWNPTSRVLRAVERCAAGNPEALLRSARRAEAAAAKPAPKKKAKAKAKAKSKPKAKVSAEARERKNAADRTRRARAKAGQPTPEPASEPQSE